MNDKLSSNGPLDKEAHSAKRSRAWAALGLGLNLAPRLPAGDPDVELSVAAGESAVTQASASIDASGPAQVMLVQAVDMPRQDVQPARAAVPAVVPKVAPGVVPARMVRANANANASEADSLTALSAEVAACQACGLCKSRTQTVFAAGNPLADLVIVGEAPGAEEDRSGLPFVGNAGKLLDNMLASLALRRDEHVYICNVLKCRPPENRDPLPDEVASCEPFLQRQLALVNPRMILVVGRFAVHSLLKTEASIASLRGRVHSYTVAGRNIPVVVTYHPAYLLRNLADKSKAWADLCLLKAEMERTSG